MTAERKYIDVGEVFSDAGYDFKFVDITMGMMQDSETFCSPYDFVRAMNEMIVVSQI